MSVAKEVDQGGGSQRRVRTEQMLHMVNMHHVYV